MSKKEKTVDELLEEALVPEEERPYEVPENWVFATADLLFDIEYGKGLPVSKLTEEGFPVYGANGKIGFYKEYTEEESKVLMTCRGATSGTINVTEPKSFVTSNSLILNPKWNTSINYVKLLFKYLDKRNLISGSAQPQITIKAFNGFPIPLPPLKEQERIAVIVDNLLNKIEKAKQLIDEAKETFELRRAAILDKAFRGKLTSRWREEFFNNNNPMSANELLKGLGERKTIKNDPLDASVLTNLYSIPKGWEWVRLIDLIDSSTYGSSSKTNNNSEGVPVIRMGNIIDGKIVFNNLKYLPNDHADVKKLKLEENDLLFNRTNSYELVGKTAVVNEEIAGNASFASYLIRVRLHYKEIISNYISYYINSHIGRGLLMTMVTQQVGQANINSKKLAALPVPLPPENELREITKMLDDFFEMEGRTKEVITVEEHLNNLKQAVLSKAFQGELQTTDPTEESSLQLLKEVLQEKL